MYFSCLRERANAVFAAKRFVEHVTSPASQFSGVTYFFIFGRNYPLMSELVHDVL